MLRTVLQHGNEEHQEKPGASTVSTPKQTRGAVLVQKASKRTCSKEGLMHTEQEELWPHNTERGQTHSLTAWGSGDSSDFTPEDQWHRGSVL